MKRTKRHAIRRKAFSKRKAWIGALLFLPFLFGFALFYIIPFCISVVYTFTKGVNQMVFVGLQNYFDVFNSTAFQLAVWNTFRFMLIGVPLIMAIAMILSLILHRSFSGSSWYRSAFLYPLVVPIASTFMVFQLLFSYTGIANTILEWLGLPVVNWLNSEHAFALLVALYIWKNIGYNIVLLLSGLNGIAKDYYEVARLEGAGKWQTFRYVTFPFMKPTLFFTLMISIINAFKSFREAYLLSGTLPHSSIYMLQHFMNNNFTNLNYQRLSVAALLTFLAVLLLLFIVWIFRRKRNDGRRAER